MCERERDAYGVCVRARASGLMTVCVRACERECVRVCIYKDTHTHTHTHTHIVSVRACERECVRVCIYKDTHTRTHTHTHTHTHTQYKKDLPGRTMRFQAMNSAADHLHGTYMGHMTYMGPSGALLALIFVCVAGLRRRHGEADVANGSIRRINAHQVRVVQVKLEQGCARRLMHITVPVGRLQCCKDAIESLA